MTRKNRLQVYQLQMSVGQGGLHLTQIRNEVSSEFQPYSIMFDCGGHGNSTALSRSVVEARLWLPVISGKRRLDLLFLSHLHDDHLNGFSRLTAGPKLEIGTLVLPYYTDTDSAFLVARTAFETESLEAVSRMVEVTNDITGWFSDRGVDNVLQIRPSADGTSTSSPDYLDRPGVPIAGSERDDGSTFEAILVEEEATTSLNSSQLPKISGPRSYIIVKGAHAEADWLLLPFVQPLSSSSAHDKEQYRRRLRTLRESVDEALLPYKSASGLDVPKEEVAGLLSALLDAYKTFLARCKWNETSLSLASGVPKSWQRPVHRWQGPGSLSWRPCAGSLEGWIWLHTGDAHLGDDSCADWLTAYQHILNDVAVFQLPHHGSVANIGDKLIGALPPEALSYATAKPDDKKHPSSLIVSKLNARGIEVWPVLTDPHTQLFSYLWIYK